MKLITVAALIGTVGTATAIWGGSEVSDSNKDQRLIGQAVSIPTQQGDGLRGRYFKNVFGKLLKERIDSEVDFYWDIDEQPMRGVPATNFSVKWTGFVKAPESGSYNLIFKADDGIRIWLNGKLLMDEWRGQEPTRFTTEIELEKDRFYAIEIEYFQANFDATAQLSWKVNGGSEETVPTRLLYSELPTNTEDFFASKNPTAYQGKAVTRLEGLEREGELTGTGLQANYFNGQSFDQNVSSGIDPVIDNYWNREPAAKGTGITSYSATWNGFVRAPQTGHYRFNFLVDDGVRLSLGNQQLINSWKGQLPNAYSSWVYLEEGQFYPIDIEYYQENFDATARLKWSYEGHLEAIVPTEVLFPELPEKQDEQEEEEPIAELMEKPVDSLSNSLLPTRGEEPAELIADDLLDPLAGLEEAEDRNEASGAFEEEERRGPWAGVEESEERKRRMNGALEGEARPEEVTLFPNPSVSGQFNLQLDVETDEVNVFVFDLNGRRIFSKLNIPVAPGQMVVQLDLQGVTAGTYLIRVQTDDSIWDTQAVVQ